MLKRAKGNKTVRVFLSYNQYRWLKHFSTDMGKSISGYFRSKLLEDIATKKKGGGQLPYEDDTGTTTVEYSDSVCRTYNRIIRSFNDLGYRYDGGEIYDIEQVMKDNNLIDVYRENGDLYIESNNGTTKDGLGV